MRQRAREYVEKAESSTAKLGDAGKHAFSVQEINPEGLFAAGAKRYVYVN
jgi:hypothetical protein